MEVYSGVIKHNVEPYVAEIEFNLIVSRQTNSDWVYHTIVFSVNMESCAYIKDILCSSFGKSKDTCFPLYFIDAHLVSEKDELVIHFFQRNGYASICEALKRYIEATKKRLKDMPLHSFNTNDCGRLISLSNRKMNFFLTEIKRVL